MAHHCIWNREKKGKINLIVTEVTDHKEWKPNIREKIINIKTHD